MVNITTHPADKCYGALKATVRGILNSNSPCYMQSYVDVRIVVNPIFPTPLYCGPDLTKWKRETSEFKVIINEMEGGCDETHLKNRVPVIRWTLSYQGLSHFVLNDKSCSYCGEHCKDECKLAFSNQSGRECSAVMKSANRLDDFWNLVYGQFKRFTLIDHDTGEVWFNVRFDNLMESDHRHRRNSTDRTIKLVWKPCCNKYPSGGTCSIHGMVFNKNHYDDKIAPSTPLNFVLENLESGSFSASWSPSTDEGSGIYYYELEITYNR